MIHSTPFIVDPSGLIIYKGYIVAEWGQPARIDITNSVTKSFLSPVIGIAVDKGLIKSVHDTVAAYVPPIEVYHPGAPTEIITPFASAHNKTLTRVVMLRQTSDWKEPSGASPTGPTAPTVTSAPGKHAGVPLALPVPGDGWAIQNATTF